MKFEAKLNSLQDGETSTLKILEVTEYSHFYEYTNLKKKAVPSSCLRSSNKLAWLTLTYIEYYGFGRKKVEQ